jgi:hypothetical protein
MARTVFHEGGLSVHRRAGVERVAARTEEPVTMALTWQQGPFGTRDGGRFLIDQPLPEHVLRCCDVVAGRDRVRAGATARIGA